MADNKENKKILNTAFKSLVKDSESFLKLRQECLVSVKLSLTGITNLVVKYEDKDLVNEFLNSCYDSNTLFRGTHEIDAVELQAGAPGRGNATNYLDELIFGSFEREDDNTGLGVPGIIKTDPQTGQRLRQPNGFVSRREHIHGRAKDLILVIKNVDYCLDFCHDQPALVDPTSLHIFDEFRHPKVKRGARILLVTNEKIKLPFKIRTIEFEPVDEYSGIRLIQSVVDLFRKHKVNVSFTDSQMQHMARKLSGLTYTEAADIFTSTMSGSRESAGKDDLQGDQSVNALMVLRKLRRKINENFMEDAVGLTHLTSKPWEDYICPESSNFTYDVKKITRDFDEISELRVVQQKTLSTKGDDSGIARNIEAIRTRMPHVIILYGKGGVGKSAFPIHFAGLLDFDVWDFNINATHSKWVGEGPERMREALDKISKATHLVVRIDEYDRAIGATSASGHGMHEAHKQVESEFMNWLQNVQEENIFVKNDIFLIMTTNHKENITGPMLRSGRADLVIDISDFDADSMKQTFISAPRRMKNRGIVVAGFQTYAEFMSAIERLDLSKLSAIASRKGITVRDIDILLQEMSAHYYYYQKQKGGLPWNTDTFTKVLEHSVGSAKADDTGELILGDRHLIEDTKGDSQTKFPFERTLDDESVESFKNVPFFKLDK